MKAWWSLLWVLASLFAGRFSWEEPEEGLGLNQHVGAQLGEGEGPWAG